ncbi:hypothetical protein PR370_06100 [Mycobacterium marinum]|uniref:hypothetical protein n=1 Tax=Mycobacterium marinum TaxID=1781 RepID=UPI0023583F42|nr:hypothetical protein [Mycobacterium marinum]MDC8982161.1 hypothetical protein [Mycobacterium marinum]MDC8998883.1 hypothetical protein [Mycobacterium marinum]MDC9009610.1 hypothetical protein [Mycobacterium marinum]
MRANAANDIQASAQAIGNARVQFRVGVHRFTATPAEALAFAAQLVNAAQAAQKGADAE